MPKWKFVCLILCIAGFLAGCENQKSDIRNQTSEVYENQYRSEVDKDQDGIDDQTDILQNAKEYISKKPQYASKYYQGGYPNNGYGVCTDVVGYALKNTGYDLQLLVDQDIRKNRLEYDIDKPDDNIDFRRVMNLKVYFKHTAKSLTLDVDKTEEWQPGDIVIWKNHIGIVADQWNDDGVPYVIHHYSKHQKNYAQDILKDRHRFGGLIGHYRIS